MRTTEQLDYLRLHPYTLLFTGHAVPKTLLAISIREALTDG